MGKKRGGFYFDRFDLRRPSLETLQQGRALKIIELNGVTSEATNSYDPKNSVFEAYRVLLTQGRIAFEIGLMNRPKGAKQTSHAQIVNLIIEFKRNTV